MGGRGDAVREFLGIGLQIVEFVANAGLEVVDELPAVLHDGRIVQNGSYDKLIAEDGPFADLVKRQML